MPAAGLFDSRRFLDELYRVCSTTEADFHRCGRQSCWRFCCAFLAEAVKAFNDLTGQKFVYLRVIGYAGTDIHRRRGWRVRCELCGRTKIVLAANLLSGRSKSCGCVAYLKARIRMKRLMLGEKMSNGMTMEQAKAELDAWLGIPDHS